MTGSTRWLPGLLLATMAGCAEDMDQQPSFQPMEEPRLHSPDGSVPRAGRSQLSAPPPRSPSLLERGRDIYGINCSHCHGAGGIGDGPAAGYLTELPANLRAPHVQTKPPPALYGIVTDGQDVMPPFRGLLAADDRWAVVYYITRWSETDEDQ